MNKYVQRALPVLITLLLAVFILRQGIRWQDFKALILEAKWRWIFLALICQAISWGAITWLNEILLSHYGARVPWERQLYVQLAMAFIEAVIPSIAISGILLRARLLKRYKVSSDVAMITTVAETGLIVVTMILMMLPFLLSLFFQKTQTIWRPLTVLVILGLVAILLSAYFRIRRFSRLSSDWIRKFSITWDERIRKRLHPRFDEWPSERIIHQTRYLGGEMFNLLRARPLAILASLFANVGFEALALLFCYYALGVKLPISVTMWLYALTKAISTLGAVPGGIGFAEVALATLYAQYGISTAIALAVALLFRLTGYWLPRVAGGIVWVWLEHETPERLLDNIR